MANFYSNPLVLDCAHKHTKMGSHGEPAIERVCAGVENLIKTRPERLESENMVCVKD